jgi:CBS domain-containing protein
LKIRHAMTGFFASAHTSSTVGDALEKMLREGLGHLWIVDDKCQLVGSIREPMLLDAVCDNQWRDHCVTRHMDRQMVTVSPEERVDAVLEKFRNCQVSEFPVTWQKRLIGVITRRQLLRVVLNLLPTEKQLLSV